MFELSLVHELAAGRHDPLEIGPVPERIRIHLGCRLGLTYLSKATFDKIMRKHADVSFYDLLLLPDLLRHGLYVPDRPRSIAVIYRHEERRKDYMAAIKVTRDELELWLTTFHRIGRLDREQILERASPI